MRNLATPSLSVYLVGSAEVGRIDVRIMTAPIRKLLEARGVDADKINRLDWPFVGAQRCASACLLVDSDQSMKLAACSDLGVMLSFKHPGLAGNTRSMVRLYPVRRDVPLWTQIANQSLATKALSVIHLTDARGIFAGTGLGPDEAGLRRTDLPLVINATIPGNPLHFTHGTDYTDVSLEDPVTELEVTNRIQAADTRDTNAEALAKLGLDAKTIGESGTAVDGSSFGSGFLVGPFEPLLGTSIADLVAPVDLAVRAGAELETVDAMAAAYGRAFAVFPTWTDGGVSAGTVPLDGTDAVSGGWRARLVAALADPVFGGSSFRAGAWQGVPWPTWPFPADAEAIPPLLALAPGWSGPALEAARGIVSVIPAAVAVTFRRADVSLQVAATADPTVGRLLISPPGLVDGLVPHTASLRQNARKWNYGLIETDGTVVPDPDAEDWLSVRVLTIETPEYALLDSATATAPINSTTRYGTQIDDYFDQGTLESNALAAAGGYYKRWLACHGYSRHSGLIQLELDDWWPGIQTMRWRFAREGEIPSTEFEGDPHDPVLGWLPRRSPGGVGQLTHEAPIGVDQLRSRVFSGSRISYEGWIVETMNFRLHEGSGLSIAYLYRVRFALAPDAEYGRRDASNPETDSTTDPTFVEMWVCNKKEILNTAAVQGTGVDVNYDDAEAPLIYPKPIALGPIAIHCSPVVGGGGWWHIDEQNAYTVVCVEGEVDIDEGQYPVSRSSRVRLFRGAGAPDPSTLRPGNVAVDPEVGRLWVGNDEDPCTEVFEIGGLPSEPVDLDGGTSEAHPSGVFDLDGGDST